MLVLLGLLLLLQANADNCVNHLGLNVDWWVILKVPPKIGRSGFGYYDSTYRSGVFAYVPDHVDEGATALTMTMHRVNN